MPTYECRKRVSGTLICKIWAENAWAAKRVVQGSPYSAIRFAPDEPQYGLQKWTARKVSADNETVTGPEMVLPIGSTRIAP